jgi:hypothetical protein
MKYLDITKIAKLIAFFSILIVAVGCATSSTRNDYEKNIEAAKKEMIVVIPLGNRAGNVADCVHKAIQGACPNLQFFPFEQFADLLFPWFELGTAPNSKEDLDALLKNSLFQERTDKLGVRYVITISGETFQGEFHSMWGDNQDVRDIMWQLTMGLDYVKADRKTDIWASVFDLKEARLLLKTESHKYKTHKYAWWLVFPLYFQPAITETPACNEVGEKIAQQLSGCEPAVDKEVEYNR